MQKCNQRSSEEQSEKELFDEGQGEKKSAYGSAPLRKRGIAFGATFSLLVTE